MTERPQLTATEAIPTYTYSWNTTPVQTSLQRRDLSPGIYEVTVDDQGACTDPVVTSIEVVSDRNLTNDKY